MYLSGRPDFTKVVVRSNLKISLFGLNIVEESLGFQVNEYSVLVEIF